MNVQESLQKLSDILPIKNTLDALDAAQAQTYFRVLQGYFQQGSAPSVEELLQSSSDAQQHLALLSSRDMLTLDDHGEVRGCYPFTSENRVHKILLNGHQVSAMCALDALAPTTMFECQSTVRSECAITAQPVHIELENGSLKNAGSAGEVYVGINWMAASSCGSCSDSLCTEMLFLKGHSNADAWKAQDSENRDIYDLPQAIEFAATFFKPMLKQG